jgi:hypothetical protein
MNHRLLALSIVALVLGCQTLTPMGALDTGPRDAPASDSSIPTVSGPFSHTVLENGVVETLVDATSETDWRYLDLETGLAVTPADPHDSDAWDLGFRRYYLITNGGVSGSGGGAAVRLLDVAFDDLTEAPETGWVADAADIEEDNDTGPDTAFNGGVESVNDWYDYDSEGHRLSPRAVSFVVRSVEGNFFKVELLGYYDGVGTPGMVRFRWARIGGGEVMLPDAGPPMRNDAGMDAGRDGGMRPLDAIDIDANSRTEWTYYRVGEGIVVITDPATSTDWDLAFQRTVVQTNSGTSGSGMGGALDLGEMAFEDVTTTPTEGFIIDELSPPAMPGAPETSSNPLLSEWYDYDFATHTVTPKPVTYAVRRADGTYAKLRIWNWVDGVFTVQIDAIGPP